MHTQTDSKFIHAVYRAYISLARGEYFSDSELGETIDDAPALQLNWEENEWFRELVCKRARLTDQQFFARGIFEKPSFVENLVYSSVLRRTFKNFADHPAADYKGNFILPKHRGFIVPVKQNGLIARFDFYGYGILKEKAKVYMPKQTT